MGEIVYLNGSLIQRSRAKISALDYGFLYGYGIFETMRAYKGKVFRLDKHLGRLTTSTKMLDISLDEVELKSAIMDTVGANKLGDARIRVTVTPGEGTINADPLTCRKSTVLIVAEKYKPFTKRIYSKGFRVITSSFRCNSQSLQSSLKSTSYLMSIMARQEARLVGADEAICLNERGLLAEASMSNIFIVVDGILRTPGLDNGILPGITRQVVIELASQMCTTCYVGDIKLNDLYRAKEAFLTNSLLEIMPLTRVGSRCIGNGRVGDETVKLTNAYKKLVSVELNTV